jgi:spermidine dehydrogenase
MTRPSNNQPNDKTLGMDARISRRDFLNATLLASGAALLHPLSPSDLLAQRETTSDEWTGYGGIGDYSTSNGNTRKVIGAAHRIRDGEFESLPADVVDTKEVYDCVVVGGGISGLAAALFFQRHGGPGKTCLVLDNHPIFGGEAKRNEFLVDGHRLIAHQGSAFFPVPFPCSFIGRFYESIGMQNPRFEYQKWAGPAKELPLPTTPYPDTGSTYGFYFGAKFGQQPGMWLVDPWGKKLEGAPISAQAKADLLRMRTHGVKFKRPQYFGDEISRHLDTMTLEDHFMERYGISRETIRTYLVLVEGGGYGIGPDALSAYSEYAADTLHPMDDSDETGAQMFPDGNSGFARLIVKTLLPDAIEGANTVEGVSRGKVNFVALDQKGNRTSIRLGATAVWVKHEGDPAKSQTVSVVYAEGKKVYAVKARSVVMAGGAWTTKHIVRDLPETHRDAYNEFLRSPCMMANVAMRNWRFLYNQGMTGCRWFEGVGNCVEVRKIATFGADSPTIGPDSPVVLTLKVLYSYPGMPAAEQGHRGRGELMATTFRDYERQIRTQFQGMFSRCGFDAQRDIAGIVLNRWGHAYLNPQPGFFFGKDQKPAPSEVLRAGPFGRIAFANTDLSGIMDHRSSILEAHRAVEQLLDQVIN